MIWNIGGAVSSTVLGVHLLATIQPGEVPLVLLYLTIHVLTAALFLLRWRIQVACRETLPNLIAVASTISVYAYDTNAPRPGASFEVGNALLLLGSLFCIFSLASLGRSFSVLPAFRRLNERHAYAAVRHPIYASYLIMDTGLVTICASTWNVSVYVVGLVLMLLRINYEERLLTATGEYDRYAKRVPYRLLPLVY